MGVELVRKYGNHAMRSCYISALKHPLLVVMVFHLIWMYRSFPLLFSLLVYASPVIVSTAVLLGTLLFFGHQNVPRISKEGKPHHHDIHSYKTVVVGDTEIDGSSSSEETHGVRSQVPYKNKTCVVNNIKINNVDHSSIKTDKKGGFVDDSDSKTSKHSRKEAKSEMENQEKNVGEEKFVYNKISSTKTNEKLQGNSIDSGPGLLWKCGEKHKDEDNKGWETGSELAESSSPSASMVDIFPMLDEQVPQHTHMPNVNAYVASDYSLDTTDVINETDDYDEDDEDDDDDDDQEDIIQVKDDDEEEEEEELNVYKEDETSMTWTIDDQKNLMNLGTSEVDRNQRLETLIARQRVLKNMRIMAEKNMVNLSPDIPFNATLISTTRKNPFDLPYDSNAHIRNNFDDPSGEKPNLPLNESFDSSTLVASRQGFNLGPYSVPEPDVTNYSSMHRHAGEVSDSKASSTPDTESTGGSTDDLEHKNHTKGDDDLNCGVKGHHHTSKHVNQSSEDVKFHHVVEDGKLEGKTSVMDDADNQEKTSSNWSSSPSSDVTDHIYDEKESEKKNSNVQMDIISKKHDVEYQHEDVLYNKDEQKTHKGTSSLIDKSTRYVEDQNDNKAQQLTYSYDKGTCKEKEEMPSLMDRSADKPTRYVEDQNVVVPNNNKEQQSTVKASSHHTGTSEEKIKSQPQESLSLIDGKSTRNVEDQNEVVPNNKEQQSTHHKGTSEEKVTSRPNELHLPANKPTIYVEDQNVVVPDNEEQRSTVKSSSHHNGTFEEKSISLPEELSLTDRSLNKPIRYAEDQNDVVPQQQSNVKASSHDKGTSKEKSIDELPLTIRSLSSYDEDQNVDVPDKQQQSTIVNASSHHNDTSEEKIMSPPEEFSLTDRSVDKPTKCLEDQHMVVPDENKEQQPTVTSPHHNGTFMDEVISQHEEKPLTQDSKELQIQDHGKHLSPNNYSTEPTEVAFSSMTSKTPPSLEYASNMNMIDNDRASEKNDDISDIEDSSVYESESEFDSDTDRSENSNTEFASASESEMSRTNEPEPRFPHRLRQVPQDLASWLTGWRV